MTRARRNTCSISSFLGTRPNSSCKATAILAFNSFFVSVQVPVNLGWVIERPGRGLGCPIVWPGRLPSESPAGFASVVDNWLLHSSLPQQTGCPAGSGYQSFPCATVLLASVPAPLRCWLAPLPLPGRRSTRLPTAASIASIESLLWGLLPKGPAPAVDQTGP